jgi:hypothetical protein
MIRAYYNGEWAHGIEACDSLVAKAKADARGARRSVVFTPTYVIYAHQILANVLMTCDEILLSDFNMLARDIQRVIPDAIVNVLRNSISCALEDYPTMFKRRGECSLGRAPDSAHRFTEAEVDLFFNDEMPDSIKTKFKQYFERLTP